MAQFRVEVPISAPVPLVWARLTDWPAHARLAPLTTIRVVGPGDRPGSGFVARTGLGPLAFDDPMETEEFEPPADGGAETGSGTGIELGAGAQFAAAGGRPAARFVIRKTGRLLRGWIVAELWSGLDQSGLDRSGLDRSGLDRSEAGAAPADPSPTPVTRLIWTEEIRVRPEALTRFAGPLVGAVAGAGYGAALRRLGREIEGNGMAETAETAEVESGLVVGDDGLKRCSWGSSHEEYRAYHDREWGRAVHGESRLFERLTLEAFQSGLAWITILRKRENFRAAFLGFDAEQVAAFDEDDVVRLLGDAGIVRNRAKINAAIRNARAVLEVRGSVEGGLDALIWSFAPERPAPGPRRMGDVPATTPESTALAKGLKRHGFAFVGPTTAYAAMQACGLVNDHVVGCHARAASGSEPVAKKITPTAANGRGRPGA